MRPTIDDKHRQKRREYLAQYNLQNGPDNRQLLDAEKEFGKLTFNVIDLYELYLADFVKTLPPDQALALKRKGGVARSYAQANAAAAAHSMMLLFMLLNGDA